MQTETDTGDVTVTEGTADDQEPLEALMIIPRDGDDWFVTWGMQRDDDGVGPTEPLTEFLVERLDLPSGAEIRDEYERETRISEKPLPEWKADPHTSSPSVGESVASIGDQIKAVWRPEENTWIVDVPDESDITVTC